MIQVKELKLAREKFLLLGPPVVVFAKNKMTNQKNYSSIWEWAIIFNTCQHFQAVAMTVYQKPYAVFC